MRIFFSNLESATGADREEIYFQVTDQECVSEQIKKKSEQ